MKGKNILLGVTGGIAAYKSIELASLLIKQGANVQVVLTKNATKFVSALTFYSITKRKVEMTMLEDEDYILHIELAEWADIIVVAPATANILGKVANGIADDLLSSIIIAKDSPVLFVPAMNSRMLNNCIVKQNIATLKQYGFRFIESDWGLMACGTVGKGRLPNPVEIRYAIKSVLEYSNDLEGKKILITAGGTREKIDPMRFISNVSSGKMGVEFSRAAALRGAEITLIGCNLNMDIPHYVKYIKVSSVKELAVATLDNYNSYDIVIMAAAVSDYRPSKINEQKIKKNDILSLSLERTEDILLEMGKRKTKQVLVGFAAESENLIENSKLKLKKKNLNIIVGNYLSVAGKNDTETVVISSEKITEISGSKFDVSNKILELVLKI